MSGRSMLMRTRWSRTPPSEHGQMALMNAVAVGLPMVRPVRAATSIATDQFGRLLATLRSDGVSEGVMVVAVPVSRVHTLYGRTGEVIPLLGVAFSVVALVLAIRRRQAEHIQAA